MNFEMSFLSAMNFDEMNQFGWKSLYLTIDLKLGFCCHLFRKFMKKALTTHASPPLFDASYYYDPTLAEPINAAFTQHLFDFIPYYCVN